MPFVSVIEPPGGTPRSVLRHRDSAPKPYTEERRGRSKIEVRQGGPAYCSPVPGSESNVVECAARCKNCLYGRLISHVETGRFGAAQPVRRRL